MHSVDKWLDGDELKGDEVQRACTMREKTLQITERQQAEIERLKNENFGLGTERDAVLECMDTAVTEAKSEAIREFAKKVVLLFYINLGGLNQGYRRKLLSEIKDLVKEMVGDE